MLIHYGGGSAIRSGLIGRVEASLKAGDTNLQNAVRDITANINSCL